MTRKLLAALLALAMILSLAACAPAQTPAPDAEETPAAVEATPAPTEEVPAAAYTPGTYTATTTGCRGEMTVEVTFDETAITEIAVPNHSETFGIAWGVENAPIDTLPAKIVETQSLGVDTVAGATITSAVLIAAVSDCVGQAGGDAAALKAVPVEKAEAQDASYDVDVVVVGAGMAGLSAAIAARENGANVLLLEKEGVTGGSSARCGGKILAAGTTWMEKQDQPTDPQLLYDYLLEVGGDFINEDLLKPLVFDSANNVTWLEERGVVFKDVEEVHSNLPIWWVHNVQGAGGMTDGHGGQFTVPLTNHYEALGGQILYRCAANELLTDGNGTVTGVKADQNGATVTVNAKSVILACGGYGQNRDMLARIPGDDGYITSTGVGNTGDGLVMASAVGAKIFDSPSAAPVFVDLTTGVGGGECGGLMVSSKGERIVNEYTYQFHTALAIERTGVPYGWYIATANDPNASVQYGMTLDTTAKASTLSELAEITGMDAATLEATVARYNELCAKGVDEDFGKRADHLWPIEGDTIYAFKMTPIISFTLGGLTIDAGARVLNESGEAIPGLYAAGEVAFTGLIGDDYPSCGMAIAAANFYGRKAAESALAD